MYFPLITERNPNPEKTLFRRKGGGGGGRGSSSSRGGKSSSSSGSGSGSSGSGKSSGSSGSGGSKSGSSGSTSSGKSAASISSGGKTKSVSSYGGGGGAVTTIPSGQLFAGRSVGGGTRSQVYGNSQYGSGYPGITGRGVADRPFPFFFWPVVWGGAAIGNSGYLYDSEYGSSNNSSRPGGTLMTAAFPSSSSQSTTLRIMADNETVTNLIQDIVGNCSSNINSPSTITASQYNDSLAALEPEQAVQYYRASSVVLTLDGYNNTAVYEPDGTPDTPLPTDIDTTLLNCMNSTIGAAVPLADGASLRWATPPSMGLVGLAYVLWCLSSLV